MFCSICRRAAGGSSFHGRGNCAASRAAKRFQDPERVALVRHDHVALRRIFVVDLTASERSDLRIRPGASIPSQRVQRLLKSRLQEHRGHPKLRGDGILSELVHRHTHLLREIMQRLASGRVLEPEREYGNIAPGHAGSIASVTSLKRR
jgi:hypothetical protein